MQNPETVGFDNLEEDQDLNITRKSVAKEVNVNRIRDENKKLKKELHRLRKIESGFFGRNSKSMIKHITIENNKYITENKSLYNNINSLEKENVAL